MTALVCLHGWSMDGRIWADAARRLAPRFRVIAPDLPGHGAAQGFPPTVDGAAEMLRGLVAGAGPVTLVGWSLGATVAWRYLARFGGEGVRGMVAVDMSPRVARAPDWTLGLRGGLALPQAPAAIAEGMFGRAGTSPVLPRAEAEARIAACDLGAMAAVWASLIEADERAGIARLPVPMLVIHGAQSRLYPAATAEWLAATAPRARRLRFAGSGHSPHLEEPERFAAAVGDFAGAFQPT